MEKVKTTEKAPNMDFITAMKNDFVTTVRKIYINSLKKEVGFREISVKEQKILSRIMIDNDQRKDMIYDAQCTLINLVCLDEDFNIYDLTEFDKIKLILALYQTNMFKNEIRFTCSTCGTENLYKLDFSKALVNLDNFDISDQEFEFVNQNWKFVFTVGYPPVKRISDFYKNFTKKYRTATKKDAEALDNVANMDYVNMFVKKIYYKNLANGEEREASTDVYNPSQIEEIFSAFPQDVLYADNGLLNFISHEFIEKINNSFEKHKCASCGTVYEDAVDTTAGSFL